jgi:putative redox protein
MSAITIHSDQGYQTTITMRNHTILTDEPVDAGGTDLGPMPMEAFIGSLGACIAVTTRAYAERKQWPLKGISVEVDMERINAEQYISYQGDAPYVYEFREHVTFEGPLSEDQLEKLHEIARKCPVRRVLESPIYFAESEVV